MTRNQQLLLLLGGAALLYLVLNRDQVSSIAESGVEDVTAALTGWKAVQQGPVWVPVINTTEVQLGIPTDLLARMAYQESRFRPDVITGIEASSAGALGILQLMPQYFQTVNVPRPYSASDTVDQISEAGRYIRALYDQFGDWGLALAAYNWGPGNLSRNGPDAMPQETSNYVVKILADVPVPSVLSA